MCAHAQLPSTARHAGAPHSTSTASHLLAAPTSPPHIAATSTCHMRCRFLPLLPSITRNVKLPIHAVRLELGVRKSTMPIKNQKAAKTAMLTAPVNFPPPPSLLSPRCPSLSAVPPCWCSSLFSFLCALCVLCGSSLSPPPRLLRLPCSLRDLCDRLRSSAGWRARPPAHIMGGAARRGACGEESPQPFTIIRGHRS
jgi:hypothetical protein